MAAGDPVTGVPASLSVPELIAYKVRPDPPPLVPGEAQRDWMDATDQRFANRCIPLSVANASGWELLCPVAFQARWFGGNQKGAVVITPIGDPAQVAQLVSSHFGYGVLTFQPGYLFRTSPGWALLARGRPNVAKAGIAPLEGLVETDWLDFTFTMNWRFNRPGSVRFDVGEPFCFIQPVAHVLLDAIQPEIRALDDDPVLAAAFRERSKGRSDFNRDLAAREPEAVARGWERHYVRGEAVEGKTESYHLSRRRLREPR